MWQQPSETRREWLDRSKQSLMIPRYERYSTRDAVGAIANFRYCLNPSCESDQENLLGSDSMFVCNECRHRACVNCNRTWHAGQTFVQADPTRRQADEALSLARIRRTALICINSKCGYAIEKNGGCSHMKCKKCGTSFCWGCLAPWEGDEGRDTVHDRDCDPERLNGAR